MTPHPYRFALSCLDTPPAPCEPPKKRHFPIEALMLACGLVAAGTGIATLRAVGHGGRVEIGPAALAHLKKPQHKPTLKNPRPHVERPTSSLAQTPLLRGGAHDSKTLLSTAKQLEALGLDVTVAEVNLPKLDWNADMWPTSTPSVRGSGGHVDGVELRGLPRDSPLRVAGLADGNQLLGINGYSFADDTIEQGVTMFVHARNLGWTVVEVARGNHHVVLSIRWPVP